MEILLLGVLSLVILVYSAILHEIMHGYIAYRFGDPTAKLLGRLTLNPIKHIDIYMSIILPVLLIISRSPVIFGGAKPVPVDPFNLRDGNKDLALVSLAGPLTNFALAIFGTVIFKIFFSHYLSSFDALIYHVYPVQTLQDLFAFIFSQIILLNLILAIFKLIPILPPLDGSKVFALLLPERAAASYMSMGNFGMLILIFLLFFPIGGFSLMGVVSNLINLALSLLGL